MVTTSGCSTLNGVTLEICDAFVVPTTDPAVNEAPLWPHTMPGITLSIMKLLELIA